MRGKHIHAGEGGGYHVIPIALIDHDHGIPASHTARARNMPAAGPTEPSSPSCKIKNIKFARTNLRTNPGRCASQLQTLEPSQAHMHPSIPRQIPRRDRP